MQYWLSKKIYTYETKRIHDSNLTACKNWYGKLILRKLNRKIKLNAAKT